MTALITTHLVLPSGARSWKLVERVETTGFVCSLSYPARYVLPMGVEIVTKHWPSYVA